MSAEFFVLAFTAALNPKLLAIDLLLVENRRSRAMFLWLLAGGLTVGVTVGLLDVLVFHLSVIHSQKTVSASVDLALGLLLLVVGALMATGLLHARRKEPVPANGGRPVEPQEKKDGWTQLLAEPRLGLAMLVGAVCGIPDVSYLAGLHILITGKASTAHQVVGAILFVSIEFLPISVPFVFLELRREGTKTVLQRSQGWLLGHAWQLMSYTALILGAYLTTSTLIRLS